MASFKTRIKQASERNGRLILANDYTESRNLESRTLKNIKLLHPYLCGIKINFHLLLSLGPREISKINKTAHHYRLQTIADIKLNDIGSTNLTATKNLWKLGFDAVIANPIMGRASLKRLILDAHRLDKGVITLCHMSAPEARPTYELKIRSRGQAKLYELFLDMAISEKADGIIAGATFPKIIRQCKNKANGRLDIYSPGIGAQGGSADKAVSAGTNYLIAGRTIIGSKNPVNAARDMLGLGK